jgi:hypothetical protein
MSLSKICCSLEHARKLEEIGVPQKSFFYWVDNKLLVSTDYYYSDIYKYIFDVEKKEQLTLDVGDYANEKVEECYSAFTAEELLPYCKGVWSLDEHFGKPTLYFQLKNTNRHFLEDMNLADMFASMLIAQHNEGELEL